MEASGSAVVTDDATAAAERSAEQIAADAALARAANPPEALGGEPQPPADVPPPPIPGRSELATKLAEQRHEGDDVTVVDEYHEARDRVSHGTADEDDLAAVTEWLLSDDAEVNTRKLRVRFGGSDDDPKVTSWFIRAIGIDTIRSAEREASGNRAQRRSGGGYDELAANLRIVVEGTALPDLKAIAKQKGLADATVLVSQKFKWRPGAIAQIAGEVMALSGFDSEDVRAAGN